MKIKPLFFHIRNHFTQKLIVTILAIEIITLGITSIFFYNINVTSMKKRLLNEIQLTERQIVSQIQSRLSQVETASDTIKYYMYALPEGRDTDPTDYLDAYSVLRKNTDLLKTIFDFRHICFFLEEETPFSNEGLMFYGMDRLKDFPVLTEYLEAVSQHPVWVYAPSQVYPFMVDLTEEPIRELLYIQGQYFAPIDTLRYIYYIGIDTEELSSLLASACPDPSVTGYLLSEDGTILASSDKNRYPQGSVLSPALLSSIQSQDSVDQDGSIYFCSTLENQWLYVTQVSHNYISTNTRIYISSFLLILLVILPLVIIIVVPISRNLTRRIRFLSNSARQTRFDQNLFHGISVDYIKDIKPADYDEIDQLTLTYNKMIEMIYANIDHITALRAQEESLKYRLLQSLINPHFLYNILDSIAVCNRLGKSELVDKMILDLTKFYRLTLHKSNDLITIRDELEISNLYLELESICRGSSFTWDIRIDEGIDNFMICKFTLQPFLENCLRHGMQGLNQQLHIQIDISYGEETILILLSDNGRGIPAEKLAELQASLQSTEVDTGKHFGICNVNARISSELFGHGFIEIDSTPEEGTTIKIEFLQIV